MSPRCEMQPTVVVTSHASDGPIRWCHTTSENTGERATSDVIDCIDGYKRAGWRLVSPRRKKAAAYGRGHKPRE